MVEQNWFSIVLEKKKWGIPIERNTRFACFTVNKQCFPRSDNSNVLMLPCTGQYLFLSCSAGACQFASTVFPSVVPRVKVWPLQCPLVFFFFLLVIPVTCYGDRACYAFIYCVLNNFKSSSDNGSGIGAVPLFPKRFTCTLVDISYRHEEA